MRKAILLALALAAPLAQAKTANDFLCGLYRVQLTDNAGLFVNGKLYGQHRTSVLDSGNNYIHYFGEKAELRVSQKFRVAFRLNGETGWNACAPLVLYQESK